MSNGQICDLLTKRETGIEDFPDLWEDLKGSNPTAQQLRLVEGHIRGRRNVNMVRNQTLDRILLEVDVEVQKALEKSRHRTISIPKDDIFTLRRRQMLGQVA